MEFERDPGAVLGMYASDADLFSRVWERVGVEDRVDCPIQTGSAPRPAAEHTERTAEVPSHTETRTETQQSMETERAEDDFPMPDDLPCLGRASASHGGQLQQYIREELEGWQLYRHLARRVNGPSARALAALASEKHRCARRLAAAHFLIAGVRCWPTDRLETPRLTSWLGVLRERFGVEQRQEHRYRAAACDTNDPCLAELYAQLAEECADHAAILRAVLESAL